MELAIVTPAEDPERESVHTLITYYNYVKAWRTCIEKGRGEEARQACVQEMQSTSLWSRLQGGGHCTRDVESAYCRGMFTLLAMHAFPVQARPELAPFANFWLPVQAYYAVHGLGLATLAAIGQLAPKDHNSFRSAFSSALVRYFPHPIGATCSGGPESDDFKYSTIGVTANDVRAQSNLAKPSFANAEHIVGKSLSTTRERLLDEKFSHARQNTKMGKRRHNLRADEKRRLANELTPTSICDFLYRMRVRANYDDPEMYLTSRDFTDQAVSHYTDLLFVTEAITDSLCTLIQRKIGPANYSDLRNKVECTSD
jgi:hypothetical protein